MAADDVFTRGRYRNKTYEEVAQLDEEFCQCVLRTTQFNDFYPEAFRAYLESRMRRNEIKEHSPKHFVRRFDRTLKAEFGGIVGVPTVRSRRVHDAAVEHHRNGFFGAFYRFVVRKAVFNAKNEDGRDAYLQEYASIFPFEVRKNVPFVDVGVRDLYDAAFKNEVQHFLRRHFDDDEVDGAAVTDLFLANISRFRREHFDERSLRSLRDIVDDVDRRSSSSSWSFRNRAGPSSSSYWGQRAIGGGGWGLNEYLRNFPRLNGEGLERYRRLYSLYNNVAAQYERDSSPKASVRQGRQYFWRLPEINCYELFALLDERAFRRDRARYARLFLKYVFFFWNAANHPAKAAIFFIDDALFECLKHYERYRKSRADVVADAQLRSALAHVTAVYRRKDELDRRPTSRYVADERLMANVKRYVESFPNVETATVDYEVRTDRMRYKCFVCTDDALLRVDFSHYERHRDEDFHEDMVRAALCPRTVRRLVYYNAFSGVETSVEAPTAATKDRIREFVRRYNKCDATEEWPPVRRLTWGLEEFFDRSTIDWATKCGSSRTECEITRRP